MDLKTLLPELNENQHKLLQRVLLEITEEAKNKSLPIAYIQQRIYELFDTKV